MPEQDRDLASLLHRLGAADLAHHVWNGEVLPPAHFERARVELDTALTAARASGEHALLAARMKRAMGAGGVVGDTIAALVHGDRDRLPAATPSITDAVPAFAVTVPTLKAPEAASLEDAKAPPVSDAYAWAAVGASALGILLLFRAPIGLLVGLAAVVSLIVVALLLIDRASLRDAGRSGAPGWGWALLPPAYLFRRARGLGRQPLHGYAMVGLGVVARIGVVVFGLGSGQLADMGGLEARLAAEYGAQWEQPATVDCPRWLTMEREATFECDVRFEDGGQLVLGFEIVDDAGGVRMTRSSFRGAPTSTATHSVAP